MKRNKYGKNIQLSLFDEIMDGMQNMTSADVNEVIIQLTNVKEGLKKKEQLAKIRQEEIEAKRKAEQERQEQEQHISEVTCMDLPLDWENIFIGDSRTDGVFAESSADGLILSLSNLGKVDIEYISAITGKDYKTVIEDLSGSIYQNPLTWDECFYKGWETAEEYLSGNIVKKFHTARNANKTYKGYFSDNIKALDKVLPPSVSFEDIYITLGSPWVPADIIDDFIFEMFGDWTRYCSGNIKLFTKHDEITGTWEIPKKSRYGERDFKTTEIYGTGRINALHILEKTLNMKTLCITDEVRCPTNASGKKRVVNQIETVAALEKQQKMIVDFQKWVWQNKRRKERLEIIFEENFSGVKKRNFNGSFLTFPKMSPEISLYSYQKDAVARILFTQNTLLAHNVGSGKTYIMIAAGMELKRMGLSAKNMYVVPNNITQQWHNIFMTMYPHANVLCIEPKMFTKPKREKILEQVRDCDYDAVIIAASCFERIPISRQYYKQSLLDEQEKIEKMVVNENKATSAIKKKKDRVKKALSELETAMDALYDGVYFDELGITRLFVDEAHNYKNLPIDTKITMALGINAQGSKKCSDMMDKVRIVQKQANGGVIFATGTPITNSITDAFVMQKYLQNGELAMLDLQSFDSWVGMFAEAQTQFEIDVDTSSYRLATRFSKFHNLPELTTLLASIADFYQQDDLSGIPQFDGYSDALIGQTADFSDYLKDISYRASAVRRGVIRRGEDNMLKITTDGRKAALDIRLVKAQAAFSPQSKVCRCAENVAHIYMNSRQNRSAQLVFCDTSTPKVGFNIYDELRSLLIMYGVPSHEIAYIHNADTNQKRNLLFAKVCRGDIRVLIGSTPKLGVGVNIQERLIALHHLDIPWRPADMTQREGRILRQGNLSEKVKIFRYITEGSFDAYSWQLLETKQRFITNLLSGSVTERSGTDIGDTALSYAEVKALAVGNPLVKERVEKANELSRYLILQKKAIETKERLKLELLGLPLKIQKQITVIANCERDIEVSAIWKQKSAEAFDKVKWTEERKLIRAELQAGLADNILKVKETPLLTYRDFKVILPCNMQKEKPFVWLKKNGRYYVELGDTDVGNLVRIDNYLDDLDKHLEKFKIGLSKLKDRKAQVEIELSNENNFADVIEKCRNELKRIDKQLGVDIK